MPVSRAAATSQPAYRWEAARTAAGASLQPPSGRPTAARSAPRRASAAAAGAAMNVATGAAAACSAAPVTRPSVERAELRRLWREAGAARAALQAAAAPVATFMAAPAAAADALLGADLAVVGLPLGGWSEAPAAVRAASQRYAGWLAAAARD